MAKIKKVKKEEKIKVEKVKVKKEDRSSFNCTACSGLGLADETGNSLCSVCNGTGKV